MYPGTPELGPTPHKDASLKAFGLNDSADSPSKMQVNVKQHPFKGRTVAVVNDLTVQEQMYLYFKTKELKSSIEKGQQLDSFRLQNQESAVYTIFMEDSTRTKESFRNAAEFHGMKVNVFDSKTSSFQKNETITDTIKMLCGYSIGQSIFVIRSKMEGVCAWLAEAIASYCDQRGFPRASFINAGDGKHEHPSQEFLDEFSFLEAQNWDLESIHIALIGDLYHGRTVHSKADGLKIYKKVTVDLIAPTELGMPKTYEDKMKDAGFTVRKFGSIEEYLDQKEVARLWYFTRLQLERMGEKVLDKTLDLRKAVTMRRDFLSRLPPKTKFFHPLPRDARFPTLPFWLDSTEYNGWDQQSQNGYFTRIVLLGMVGGQFGDDFSEQLLRDKGRDSTSPLQQGVPRRAQTTSWSQGTSPLSAAGDFITEVLGKDQVDPFHEQVGLVPISNGIAIRDIGRGQEIPKIWNLMYMIRWVMGLDDVGGHGIYSCGQDAFAGFITVPNFDIERWDRGRLKRLAAITPGSILQVVKDSKTLKEFELSVPPRIYNFENISCRNVGCISHPGNMQHEVPPYFLRNISMGSMAFACKYCEVRHDFWQIWNYDFYQKPDSA